MCVPRLQRRLAELARPRLAHVRAISQEYAERVGGGEGGGFDAPREVGFESCRTPAEMPIIVYPQALPFGPILDRVRT